MEEFLLYFVLGPLYLVLELLHLTGLVDGSPDSVRTVGSALGTACYAALLGRGI